MDRYASPRSPVTRCKIVLVEVPREREPHEIELAPTMEKQYLARFHSDIAFCQSQAIGEFRA